jgi:BolA family transcriptional regulator, general stress-responsive regulator
VQQFGVFRVIKYNVQKFIMRLFMTRQFRMETELNMNLSPDFLQVINESSQHHVPNGSETHFKVIVVSQQFNELTKIARHRTINKLLEDEFSSGLHALTLHLYTPTEFANKSAAVPASPPCANGWDK